MKINESGRSMIEMLGVLAIIGVLSVGGIAGYSKAMGKFRVNKTIDQVTHVVANTRILFGSQRTFYKDLGACPGNLAAKNVIIKAKLVPDSMPATNDQDNNDFSFSNAYAGKMYMCAGGRLSNGDNKAFAIALTDIPSDACIELATQDWGAASGSGLVAMRIVGDTTNGGSEAGGPVLDDYFPGFASDTCSSDHGDGYATICGQKGPMTVSDATRACNCDFNHIYFKFY